jgi:hypothetical protein
MRSNTHASARALWLSRSADLICGDSLDVIRITLEADAGYLALRRDRVNRAAVAVGGHRQIGSIFRAAMQRRQPNRGSTAVLPTTRSP